MEIIRCLCAAQDERELLEDEYWAAKAGHHTEYQMVDGNTLYVTHGGPDGLVINGPVIAERYSDGDKVICCYPQQVAQQHPQWDVVCDAHDGIVKTSLSLHYGVSTVDIAVTEEPA